jgi:uncharacterized membrane protein SirB2
MTYIILKHLHMTAAALSLIFFIVRSVWSVNGSAMLQKKFVRIAPHVIDTVLLVCGLALGFMLGIGQSWILAKIVGVIAYIVVGTFAIKRGRTPASRGTAAVLAILIFAYIVGVAVQHNPWSWLA